MANDNINGETTLKFKFNNILKFIGILIFITFSFLSYSYFQNQKHAEKQRTAMLEKFLDSIEMLEKSSSITFSKMENDFSKVENDFSKIAHDFSANKLYLLEKIFSNIENIRVINQKLLDMDKYKK